MSGEEENEVHMTAGKRIYWVLALVALLALAGAALTMTSRLTSAGDDDTGDDEIEVASGQIDDGKDLLPQAGITLEQALAAAQSAASGAVGEVDLEHYQGKLVFNVDVGDKDVKVDASTGAVIDANSDD